VTIREVPASGLVGRARPDAALPPARTLASGSRVRVVGTMGAWAEVDTGDGWTGWVDGRRLLTSDGPAAPARPNPVVANPMQVPAGYPSYAALFEVAAQPASETGTPAVHTPPAASSDGPSLLRRVPVPALVGAGLLALSAVLPWLRYAGRTLNPFDVPVQFLVDFRNTGSGGVDMGLLLVGLAVGALVLSSRPALARWRRVDGGAAVVVPTLFTAQLQRVLSDLPAEGRPTLFGALGIGVLLAVVGGVLVLWGGPRRPVS
jgi:hypothetical protein